MTNFLEIFEQELRAQATTNAVDALSARGLPHSTPVTRAEMLSELADIVARLKPQLTDTTKR